MVCPRCGNDNLDTSIFCGTCGNDLRKKKTAKFDKKQKIVILLLLVVFLLLFALVGKKYIHKDSRLSKGTRTIMIYMAGSNLESKYSIGTASLNSIDYNKMDHDNVRVLLLAGGSTKWHNDYIKQDTTAIYELTSSGYKIVKDYNEQRDMGDPDLLYDFLKYSYDNYKSDHYDLILDDHGGAIEGAIYDELFTDDNITLEDFDTALSKSPFSKDNKLETILFSTCLNGTIEVASVLDDYADFLIASEEVTEGSPNYPVLSFINDLKYEDTAEDYGKKFINLYGNQIEDMIANNEWNQGASVYALIDLSKIDSVINELNSFIEGLNVNSNYSDISRARANLYQYGYTIHKEPSYDTVDLKDLVESLNSYSNVDASKVVKALDDAIVYLWRDSKSHNGISIFFPYNGSLIYQSKYLSISNSIKMSDTYYKFIKDFHDYKYKSNNTSSYSKGIMSNKVEIKGNEFSLQLTEDQAKDFARAEYMVFKENKDNTYSVLYSADDAKLEGTTLKTNVSDNLIKIVFDNEEIDDYYVRLYKYSDGENETYLTSAAFFYWPKEEEYGDILNYNNYFKSDAVIIYFKFDKDNNPYIGLITKKSSDSNMIDGVPLKMEDYNDYEFPSGHYKVLDENGKYLENWESVDLMTGFSFNDEDNYHFERAILSKDNTGSDTYATGKFICVFKVFDVYGNYYYTNYVEY